MKARSLALVLTVLAALAIAPSGQENSATATTVPLVLTGAIPLSNVKGRIDHFSIDLTHNRLFLSALGNNTVEVIDISTQAVVRTISGVPVPQGIVYSPDTNKLFVGSDKGKLYIYDGSTFDLITSIDFGDDVDNPAPSTTPGPGRHPEGRAFQRPKDLARSIFADHAISPPQPHFSLDPPFLLR